ncbi:MAG: hypothetical protein Q4G45_09220 [Actinomycetia bacterium]|nr:hypothetical protein [Actinomycetes bacterium]
MTLEQRVRMVANEIDASRVMALEIHGGRVIVSGDRQKAVQPEPGGEIQVIRSGLDGPRVPRRIESFELADLARRYQSLDCGSSTPVVMAESVFSGHLLVNAGCYQDGRFTGRQTVLGRRELVAVPGMTPEHVDQALADLAEVAGPRVVRVDYRAADSFSGEEIRVTLPTSTQLTRLGSPCSPQVTRSLDFDGEKWGMLMSVSCESSYASKPERPFALADVAGADVVRALEDLKNALQSHYERKVVLDWAWVERRDDGVLVMSTPGAYNESEKLDLRIPLRRG